ARPTRGPGCGLLPGSRAPRPLRRPRRAPVDAAARRRARGDRGSARRDRGSALPVDAYFASLLHTMNRRERQATILDIVGEQALSTQSELAEALRSAGHDVVQTTVSRDVHELGLVKVRAPSGRLVYAEPGSIADRDRLGELRAALRRWALAIDANESLAVAFTPAGYASALAQALDQAGHPDVLAT